MFITLSIVLMFFLFFALYGIINKVATKEKRASRYWLLYIAVLFGSYYISNFIMNNIVLDILSFDTGKQALEFYTKQMIDVVEKEDFAFSILERKDSHHEYKINIVYRNDKKWYAELPKKMNRISSNDETKYDVNLIDISNDDMLLLIMCTNQNSKCDISLYDNKDSNFEELDSRLGKYTIIDKKEFDRDYELIINDNPISLEKK